MATNRRPNDGPRIPRSKSLQAGRIGAGESTSPTVAGVRISHPDRVIYPDLGISKIQLVRYYEGIADWIMPHVIGRPLTLLHCPAGSTRRATTSNMQKRGGQAHYAGFKYRRKQKLASTLSPIRSRLSSRSRRWELSKFIRGIPRRRISSIQTDSSGTWTLDQRSHGPRSSRPRGSYAACSRP